MPVQTMHGVHGVPDFVCCIPVEITPEMVGKTVGMFVGIEAKDGDNEATALQAEQLRDIHTAGGIATVITGIGEDTDYRLACIDVNLAAAQRVPPNVKPLTKV